MKVALCGYPPFIENVIAMLKNSKIECTHFISDLTSTHGEENLQLPTLPPIIINFFDFRKLIVNKEIDGVIIAEDAKLDFVEEVVKLFKFHSIKNVGILNLRDPFQTLHWLDNEKIFIKQLETNINDSCNLNCKACTHFSNLFEDKDIYSIKDYTKDLRQIANTADIVDFFILGGEPFKIKNLDEYLKITRKILPNSNLRITTNGLLVPKLSQKILNSLRENKFVADVSMYPPTVKMIEEIEKVFNENNIPYKSQIHIHQFNAFLTLHGGHNPLQSRQVCANDTCRFLRNGKIYKCPTDALSYKFVKHFGIKDFPAATGIDIFAKNFSQLMEQLDGNIELCTWCNETVRLVDWTPENNPKLTDWLANPAEVENFLPK